MYIFVVISQSLWIMFFNIYVCCKHRQQKALHCSYATLCVRVCVYVSPQWISCNIPVGYLKQLKYSLMICVSELNEMCFLRGMWILPKKKRSQMSIIVVCYFFLCIAISIMCLLWIDLQMWTDILTFFINNSCNWIIAHATQSWLNTYCFELCSLQNKISTSSPFVLSAFVFKSGLKQWVYKQTHNPVKGSQMQSITYSFQHQNSWFISFYSLTLCPDVTLYVAAGK